MIEIVAIDTPELGDRAYLATDGVGAIVVDPQRDIDRVERVAAQRGVPITHVFETHIHNDYLTGGLALARSTGAAYHLNVADRVSFARTPVADGDRIDAGAMRIQVIGTPGHTFTHLAYALSDQERVLAVFTGGSLLNGSTGRTDLLGAEHELALTKAQFASAHRLAAQLPGSAAVYPTHGFGSFCSATPTTGGASTMADEMRVNPVLTRSETDYVTELLAGLDAYPAYYAHMSSGNTAGPSAPDLTPPRIADASELRRRIDAGEWVVDLRSRTAFAAGHLVGSLNFELDTSFATYLGWLIPWSMPLTLIGDTPEAVATAQRDLCRIGIDRIEAAATGQPAVWAANASLEQFPSVDFTLLAGRADRSSLVVLDVRLHGEWQQGYIEGSLHIPLHQLAHRMDDIPAGEIWVHCGGGYRAAIAASLLAARGRQVVAVDDNFSVAAEAGLPVVTR